MLTIPFDNEKNRKFFKKRGLKFCRCIVCDRNFPEILMLNRGVSVAIHYKNISNAVLRDGAPRFEYICDDCVKVMADVVENKKKKSLHSINIGIDGMNNLDELDGPGIEFISGRHRRSIG